MRTTNDWTFYPGGRELVLSAIAAHEARRGLPGWREPMAVKSSCYAYPDGPLVALRDAAGPVAVYKIGAAPRSSTGFDLVEHVLDGGIEDLPLPCPDRVVALAWECRRRVSEYLAIDEERAPSRIPRAAAKMIAAERRVLNTPATSIRGVIEKLLVLWAVPLDDTDADHAGIAGEVWGVLQDLQILEYRFGRSWNIASAPRAPSSTM